MRRVLPVLSAWLLVAAAVVAAPTLTVSPAGDDTAPGSPDAPLATLGGALQRARELRTQGEVGELRIEIQAGEYLLPEPLVLAPSDAELTFAAVPGAKVVISGGRLVAGWTKWRDGIWQAPLPEGVGTDAPPIRQLFYDGEAQPRSRYPNPVNGDWRYTGWLFVDQPASEGDRRAFLCDLGKVPAVAQPQQAEVDIFPWNGWNNSVVGVAALDVATGRVELTRDVSYKLSPGNRFRFENAPEWIDQPGEWAVDTVARMVYLQSPATGLAKLFGGGAPNKPVLVPALGTLVSLQGDGATSQSVRNISFVGLEFVCSLGGSAVVLDTVRDCRFEACAFRDLGGTAIEFRNASRGNIITSCTFARLGGAGVTMFPGTTGHCTDNVISHNHFHDLGLVDRHVAAVYGGTSNGNLIAQNLIHHMPRYAISFKHGFGRNIIEWNEIRWTNLETNDTGAIESWQWEPGQAPEYDRGNVIRYNLIADTVGLKAFPGGRLVAPTYTWGIYMDDFSSRNEIVGNLIVRNVLGGICLHGGWENLCQYNISVDSSDSVAYYNNIQDKMRGNRILNNIFYHRNGDLRLHLGGFTDAQTETHDFNLYWPAPSVSGLPGAEKDATWAAWLSHGYDASSQTADPLFVSPAADDYRLQDGSPALPLGFRATDFSKVGLRGTPMWTGAVQAAALAPVKLPPQLPAAQAPGPQAFHAERPLTRALLAAGTINVDGVAQAGEWPGLYSTDRMVIGEKPNYGGAAKSRAFASVMHDAERLLVAVDVPVPEGIPNTAGTQPKWGQDDGIELCVQAVSTAGEKGPILVLRGYPSGQCESSTEAGATAEQAQAAGTATVFAALGTQAGWTAEYAVPLAQLGVAGQIDRLRLNLGIRKSRSNEWLAWVGTSAENWRVGEAGVVDLRPSLDQNASRALQNGGFDEPDGGGARSWHWFGAGDAASVGLAPEGPDGTLCLKLEASAPQTKGTGAMQAVTMPVAGSYYLGLQLRGQRLKADEGGGVVVSVRCLPIAGKATGEQRTVTRLASLWERCEVPVTIPPDTAVMAVTVQLRNATGTVWIDQLSLRQVAGE